ncbi:tyrosine-type recombinase/integrase, partial [Thermodesulfobacteriota bacterium]
LTFEEVSGFVTKEWEIKLNNGNLRQKTFDGYISRVNVLDRIFGKRLLCEISRDDLISYRNRITTEVSCVTANRNLFVIKQIFKHGLEIKAVIKNPVEAINYLSEKSHERNNFILPAMIIQLVEASLRTRAKHYMPALIYLGAEHGASRQEALSLKWKDINFDYDERGYIHFFRTKNNMERTEYLMPRTKQALLKWSDHQRWMRRRKKIDYGNSDFVFCRLDGTPIKRFDTAWKEVCRISKINDFHFHDLRHTFCSNLLLSGSNLKDVKEMIGHSDLSMTDRYSHLTLKHKLLQQEKLAAHYAQGT